MSKKEKFADKRWNDDPKAVVIETDENFKLTKEDKNWIKEQDKKWQETLKKIKKQRGTK